MEGGSRGNPDLASQLKAYDGSGATRVSQIKSIQAESPTSTIMKLDTTVEDAETEKVGHWAYFGSSERMSGCSRIFTNPKDSPT